MPDISLSISLTQNHLAQLEKHARESLPRESCAFLLGGGAEQITISEILVVKDAGADQVSFSVPVDELLKVYKTAEEKKLQVAGIFHSHPASPKPSSTDARFMEVNPVVWVIYSTTEYRFAAWVYSDRIRPVQVVIC